MKKHTHLLIVATILLAAGLSSCNLGEPECLEMPASWAYERHFTIWNRGPGIPVTFSWYYPGTCQPDSFRIIMNDIPMIGENPLVDEIVSFPGRYVRTVLEDGTSAIYYTWTTTETFLDGYYWWWVIPYSGEYHGERSPENFITITTSYTDDYGDTNEFGCPPGNYHLEEYAELVYPSQGSTIHTQSPRLVWRNRNDQITRCHLVMNAVVVYSQETDNLDLNEISYTQAEPGIWPDHEGWVDPPGIFTTTLYWDPRSVTVTLPECTRTYWQVYTILIHSEGTVVWPSEIHYFDILPEVCEGMGKSLPLYSQLEAMVLVAVPWADVNCRSGPTLDYPLLSILPAGAQYEIQARNTAGDAWMVFDPAINTTCWVAGDLVEVLGDTSLVQIIDPMPPETPEPDQPTAVDCSQWSSDQQACTANPACQWNPNLNPTSPCVNK